VVTAARQTGLRQYPAVVWLFKQGKSADIFIENKVGDFLIHGVRTSATNKKLLWPENNIIVMNKWNSLPLVLAFVFFVCGVMFWRAYAQRTEF